MKRTWIIIRHAHRNKTFGSDFDNGLSAKGRKQAKRLLKFYAKRFGSRPPWILCSPKLRCTETVQPIARKTRARIHLSEHLDEGGNPSGKARALLRELRGRSSKTIVLCSHGDIIPALLKQLTRRELSLSKGGWAELELNDQGRIRVSWVIQDFSVL